MIIKNRHKRSSYYLRLLWFLPLLLLVLLWWNAPKDPEVPEAKFRDSLGQDDTLFYCDLESDSGEYFVAGNQLFEGLSAKNTEHAYSGTNSIALNSLNVFGLTTWFKPPSYEATYHLRVRRYNPNNLNSYLVVAGPEGMNFYESVNRAKPSEETNDWELLDLLFRVPREVDSVKIYCYVGAGSGGNVYFDDLSLSIQDIQSVSRQFNIPALTLIIDEQGLSQLKQKRTDALASGLLIKEDDDWVKSKVVFEDRELNARLRLKGDWLDHLTGDNWSFRVKLKDPYSLWGMKTFNLQKPDTRGLLKEWIYHKMLGDHQILSPRYEFVLISLNGKNLGFYAIEEHFEKELVESQSRRDGPILKFSEERLWNGLKRQFDDVGKNNSPLEHDKENAFNSAPIEAFSPEDYQKTADLSKQYERGLELMGLYKHGASPASRVFDPDLLGKYLAIVDLCVAYHNLTWHNQRWYYNPLSDRLEPIGFDGFGAESLNLSAGMTLLSEEAYRADKDRYEPFRHFFRDPLVVSSYANYLDSLSSKVYLDSFFLRHLPEITAYSAGLEEEYDDGVFDRALYENRAAQIRLTIPAYSESVQFYRVSGQEVFVVNNHVLPIRLLNQKDDFNPPGLTLIWPVNVPSEGQSVPWVSRLETIDFAVVGSDIVLTAPIRQALEFATISTSSKEVSKTLHPLCVKDGDHYVLASGKSDTPIIVPEGATLIAGPGVELNLTSGAYLMTSGPIDLAGEEDLPIRIFSEDGTGAMVVRQAGGVSKVEHVIFDGLGRIDNDGYILTGGVTFYQSDVEFTSCLFRNNTQEDALNVVRSNFILRKCVFENTAFDAFDSDFSTGTMEDCFFQNTGNDAIDFSGSQASIINCTLKNIGDKGVSVGEHSTIHISTLRIDKAVIGVASKDLSILTIDFIDLQNVGTAFTAYQKKPSFGPAKIIVTGYKIKNTPRLHLIERKSSLVFKNGPVL
jgi:hypothetical protein